MRTSVIWWVLVITRTFTPLILLIDPLIGWIVCVVLDTIDYPFAVSAGLSFLKYQYIDKSLDTWFNIMMVTSSYMLNWPYKEIFLFLLVFRMAGGLLFRATKKQIVLLLFPNFLEFSFLAYAIFVLLPASYRATETLIILGAGSVLLKVIQEYFIHFTDYIDPVSKHIIAKHPEHKRMTRTMRYG